jgi:hypothetical protein
MILLRNDTEAPLFHTATMTGFPVGELVDCSLFSKTDIDDELVNFILDGSLVFNDGASDRSPRTAIALLEKRGLSSSVAVDMNNLDQNISGTDAVHINHARVIWDLNVDFDTDTGEFVVPFDGVYSGEIGTQLKNLTNVAKASVVIYKGEDQWFILDEKFVPSGAATIYLTNTVRFDMYEDERFDIRVQLVGDGGGTPSATINGDDDFTAWGFDLSHVF